MAALQGQERETVEASIGSMIVNLGKFRDHLVETGEGCKWCVFNLLNDMDFLESLFDEYAPKGDTQASA